MAAFEVSPYIPVGWGDDEYRVMRADGKVQHHVYDYDDDWMWVTIGGDLAHKIRNKSGWLPEEDGWRPSWWFGAQSDFVLAEGRT
jgi:hypothetical protein